MTNKKAPYWWLSFADPDRPKGEQFLGAAIVQGKDMIEAIRLTHLLEINPGGQVKGVPIPNGEDLPDNQVNRLLSIKDMEDLGMEPVRWKEN